MSRGSWLESRLLAGPEITTYKAQHKSIFGGVGRFRSNVGKSGLVNRSGVSITVDGLPGTWKCLGAWKVAVVGVAHLGSG